MTILSNQIRSSALISFLLLLSIAIFCCTTLEVVDARDIIIQLDGERTCDPGYHMEADSCEPNECSCDNGIAVAGERCAKDNTEICESCNEGYYMKGDLCEINTCDCDNGIGAEGINCSEHGLEFCESCDVGYRIDPHTDACIANECFCEYGRAADGAECDEHKKHVCGECFSGYFLNDESICTLELY